MTLSSIAKKVLTIRVDPYVDCRGYNEISEDTKVYSKGDRKEKK